MVQKLLSGMGILALIAWTVGGAFAWYSVKQKVQITISEPSVRDRHEVDRVALVEEAVSGLRQDVQALSRALETNLGALATDLQDGNTKRIAEVRSQLGGLERRIAELASSTHEHRAMLETVLAELRSHGKAAPGARDEVSSATPDPVPAAKPGPPEQRAGAEKKPATPVVEAPARRFLTFRLPSASFAFDKPQKFEIIASLSRVGFDAKSTLHDFTGVTSKVSGGFTSNLAAPAGATRGRITVQAGTLDTGLESRNTAMRDDHLEVAKFPDIVFELADVRAPKADAKAMTVTGTAVGKMTIHGVTRELKMPIRAKVDASRRLVVEGETKLKLSDFKIPIPSKLGFISVHDELNVWISLRARPGAGR